MRESVALPVRSMRARMTGGLTLFVALLTAMGGGALWLRSWAEANAQSHTLLNSTASQLRQKVKRGATWEELAALVGEQNRSAAFGEVEMWQVDANERPITHTRLSSPPPDGAPPRPENAPNLPARLDKSPIVLRLPVPPLDDPNGWLMDKLPFGKNTLIVGVPWHKTRHILQNQGWTLLLLGLLTSGAAGLGAWVLVGRTLSPIEQLASQALSRSQEGRYAGDVVLQAPSPDREMRDLVATLNTLLSSLAAGVLQRERFHAAASHELRTPLQALSGTLQLALSRPRNNEDYRTALQGALTQTERLNALTRDLLTLNQLGMGTSRPHMESVDVAEVCDLTLSSLQSALSTKALQLAESLSPLEIEAPPSHVEMLCRNLLENAVKYAPQRGQISVETTREGTQAQLRIWNETNEVPSDLTAWIEPFIAPI